MEIDAPLQLEIKPDSVGGHEITRLKISGAVDALSTDLFQEAIEEWLKERPDELVLDFGGLTFLSSAAASLLGTLKSEFGQAGIDFVIVHVPEAIMAVLTLIGLHEVIPLMSNDAELAEFMKSGPPGQRFFNRSKDAGASELTDTLRPEDSTVLMVTPREDRFAEVTKLRLATPKSNFEFVFNCEEAREMFNRLDPDLVIIEDQLEGAEGFLTSVKTEKGKSISPIVKLYLPEFDPDEASQFKIWEDAFLVEPFEMGELFKLSETKLQELPDNRQVMLHLTHFEFKGNQHQVDKALQLTWKLLNISGLEDQKQRDFQKAFEEAVKNGIRHGHRGDKAKSLDVVFMMNNEVINVTVEDKGSGFNYQQFFEDTPQKKESGFYPMRQQHQRETRGMKILDENCDRVEYLGAGNCVRLTKFIPKAT